MPVASETVTTIVIIGVRWDEAVSGDAMTDGEGSMLHRQHHRTSFFSDGATAD